LSVIGSFQDGTTQVITERVQWTTSDANVVQVTDGINQFQAVGEGGATITATMLDFVAYQAIIVGPPVCETLAITPTNIDMKRGAELQMAASCKFSDGTERDVTGEVNWTTQNSELLTVNALGVVEALGVGDGTITGQLGVAEVVIPAKTLCAYPGRSTSIAMGGLFPGLTWAGAYTANGEVKELNLEDFHCSETYKDYTTINFIVGTEWCPNCPGYMRNLENMADDLKANGGLLVYVEIQDQQRRATDSSEANRIVNKYIQSDVGWRVGDTDSTPTTRAFGRAIMAIPDAFVVRKSDMKVIGHRNSSNSRNVDFLDMAASPEAY